MGHSREDRRKSLPVLAENLSIFDFSRLQRGGYGEDNKLRNKETEKSALDMK